LIHVIAHRGASAYEFENSPAAFLRAVELGADGIELDVHSTADGVPVVHHDDVAGGQTIAHADYIELKDHKLENGEALPTLEAVLSMLDTAVDVFVELKTLPAEHDQTLLNTLDSGPAPHRYSVHSFDHRIIRRLKTRRPSLPAGILSVAYPVDPIAPLEAAGAVTLWQQERTIDGALVQAIQQDARSVYAWTVDNPNRIEQLAELGVNGICTNRPDVARKVLS
jgi:glycerophosphoryl diester phosphodiesterase